MLFTTKNPVRSDFSRVLSSLFCLSGGVVEGEGGKPLLLRWHSRSTQRDTRGLAPPLLVSSGCSLRDLSIVASRFLAALFGEMQKQKRTQRVALLAVSAFGCL